MTPQTSHASEILHYAYGDTSLGDLVVAKSAKGVVGLFIGDDRERLLRDLTGAFPSAKFVFDPVGLAETVVKAMALVEAPHLGTVPEA